MQRPDRCGLTLIEILVVIAIIGLMIQMALPALEHANESARKIKCQDNVRQLALGILHHYDTIGHFPTDGWGWKWVGDPDRGYDRKQPGSWQFNVLEFIDSRNARIMASGLKGERRAEALVQMCATPIPTFVCPDRRLPRSFPVIASPPGLQTQDEFHLPILSAAKSDYAINTGDYGEAEPVEKGYSFPATLENGDSPDFKWYDTSKFTGISFGRSEIRIKDVTDGTSKTYMIGEKYMLQDQYVTGIDKGDNVSMYSGFSNDNGRSSKRKPMPDGTEPRNSAFGSAHPDHWNAAFCDGSVHAMAFGLDKTIHDRLANRCDGLSVELDDTK